jgi:hypothetical protein
VPVAAASAAICAVSVLVEFQVGQNFIQVMAELQQDSQYIWGDSWLCVHVPA